MARDDRTETLAALVPCPWCDHLPDVVEINDPPQRWWVHCSAVCPVKPGICGGQETREEAVALWNSQTAARGVRLPGAPGYPQLSDVWDAFVTGASESRENPTAGLLVFHRAADAYIKTKVPRVEAGAVPAAPHKPWCASLRPERYDHVGTMQKGPGPCNCGVPAAPEPACICTSQWPDPKCPALAHRAKSTGLAPGDAGERERLANSLLNAATNFRLEAAEKPDADAVLLDWADDLVAAAALLRQPGAPRTEPSDANAARFQTLVNDWANAKGRDRRAEWDALWAFVFGGGSASEGGTRP